MFVNAMDPQVRDRDLAPHPHRVELVGDPDSLVWPNVCANCGANTRERIRVGKVFLYQYGFTSDLPDYCRVAYAPVPFCSKCIAQHRRETQPTNAALRLVTGLFNQMAIPMVLAGGTALFCAKEAAAALPDTTGAGVMGGVALFFGLIAAASAQSSWAGSRRFRIPPQTSVTLACDFSDDISKPFDPQRRVYAIRNAAFAEAFTAANRQDVWETGSPRAARGKLRRRLATAALILIAAIGLVWKLIGN